MGNFSRNTFDPTKRYVGVRLQQGVPLVDADWNELNDVVRNEVYTSLSITSSDGIEAGTEGLAVSLSASNDLQTAPGRLVIGGQPLTISQPIIYSQQPWTVAARAAADGVAQIPALTTPALSRTDSVYFDIWEREVNSQEDHNLVNTSIGIETCVRICREVALRVAEGASNPPAAPPGHTFFPLALLNRVAGPLAADQIADARPFLPLLKGVRRASFVPNFTPFVIRQNSGSVTSPPTDNFYLVRDWSYGAGGGITYSNQYYKPLAVCYSSGKGVLHLPLPEGARMLDIRVCGSTTAALTLTLTRSENINSRGYIVLLTSIITGIPTPFAFDRTYSLPADNQKNIVANGSYYYSLFAEVTSGTTEIHGVSIRYY